MTTFPGRRTRDPHEGRAVIIWTRLRRRQLQTARQGQILESARYASRARRTGMAMGGRRRQRSCSSSRAVLKIEPNTGTFLYASNRNSCC